MTNRLLAAAVACFTLLGATQAAHASTASVATPPSTASGVHAFHGLQGVSNTLTLAVAQQTARESDVVSATPGQLSKYATAMKAANPSVILLAYVNGGYSKAGVGYPASDYLRNASGGQITSTTHGNVLMNPLSAHWQASVAAACNAAIGGNVSGCWLDQVSCAPLTAGFDTAQPIDSSAGAAYTKPAWASAITKELDAVKTAIGSAPVYSNTYCSGQTYAKFPLTGVNSAATQGFEAEHWLTAQTSNWTSPLVWQQGINMMIDAQAHGKVVTISGNPTSGVSARYLTASYMLGNNGAALTTLDNPIAVNVGAPTQTATSVSGYQHGSVYARTYQNGIVIVNPTALAQTYAGHTVAAHGGYIGA
jgi:hypothetical protein